jgi:hypothetical protein
LGSKIITFGATKIILADLSISPNDFYKKLSSVTLDNFWHST